MSNLKTIANKFELELLKEAQQSKNPVIQALLKSIPYMIQQLQNPGELDGAISYEFHIEAQQAVAALYSVLKTIQRKPGTAEVIHYPNRLKEYK